MYYELRVNLGVHLNLLFKNAISFWSKLEILILSHLRLSGCAELSHTIYSYNLSYIAPFNKYIPTCNKICAPNWRKLQPQTSPNPKSKKLLTNWWTDDFKILTYGQSSPESSGTGLKSGSAYDLVDLVTLAPLLITMT